jgi:prolyl-tRNA synthetase
MKDLYTFDYSPSLALETYHSVRQAYARLFDELKIPYLVADADSGQIGGDLSHEFHFPTAKGEDNIISCNNCDYVANEELAESAMPVRKSSDEGSATSGANVRVWRGISRDKETLINVWYQSSISESEAHSEVNMHAIKSIMPDLDASIEDPLPFWKHHQVFHAHSVAAQPHPIRLVNLVDTQISVPLFLAIKSQDPDLPFWPNSLGGKMPELQVETLSLDPSTGRPLNLMRIQDGDSCKRCPTGVLKVEKAIELGHTFYLGTRYSEPMEAMVTVPTNFLQAAESKPVEVVGTRASIQVPMQMGCHGIGVSRIIGAVADTLADEKGLNWPRVMAPYEVLVIPGKGLEEAALDVYDVLSSKPNGQPLDLILDDRAKAFPWKMNDADLVGYPVIVIVGKKWKEGGKCEVQCRRLKIRQDVLVDEVSDFIQSLLDQL